MRHAALRIAFAIAAVAGSLGLASCSGNGTAAPETTGAQATNAPVQTAQLDPPAAPFVPPAVSIGQNDALPDETQPDDDEEPGDDDGETPEAQEPEAGTAEWLLREIARLQSAPLDRIRQPIVGKPGEFEEVHLTASQIAAEESRRAKEIIGLALEVCTKTRGDAAKEQIFNTGVHRLAVARRTLALAGDLEQPKLLAEEAETLYRLDSKSFAAIESHLQLVELLQQLAEREGRANPEWAQGAARQARLFASRFPQESIRAAMTLLTASKACESSGLYSDAKGCLLTLEKDYGKTPFAEQAAGALRRYRLTGTVLEEFAGPTIDGAFLSIDQFRGQPVLIVFWSSESKNFREDLPRLRQAIADFGDSPLTILGVNLDQDEAIVDSALEQADLPWRTIFSTDPEQRGLRNPLARAYGVTTSPQYWVVDGDGKVLAAPTDLAGAEKSLATLH